MWASAGLRAVALEPGFAMAAAANRRPGVSVVRARSQAMPFAGGTFALVYFHLSLHYGDWERSIDEALRVLGAGGRCMVWTLGPRHHRSSMLAKWFPSVATVDDARFPPPGAVADRLAAAGSRVEAGGAVERVERSARAWAAAVRDGFVSTLQLIDRDEIDAGLAAFERAHPDPDETVRYQMHWEWIRASAPR